MLFFHTFLTLFIATRYIFRRNNNIYNEYDSCQSTDLRLTYNEWKHYDKIIKRTLSNDGFYSRQLDFLD